MNGAACKPMSLSDAIALAFRLQPRLRVYLEGVEQARGGEQIAFSPFLPTAGAGYHVGGFNLNAGGEGVPLGNSPVPVAFLPPSGVVPIPLNIDSGYELADCGCSGSSWTSASGWAATARRKSPWTWPNCRRSAYQTTADEVETAYYQVLRTAALRRTAEEAVRRTEDDLDLARKLKKGDVVLRENVLRAEVELAQARHGLDVAQAAAAVAGASLNLAVGLNVSAPTVVEDATDPPPFHQSLADCLRTAVAGAASSGWPAPASTPLSKGCGRRMPISPPASWPRRSDRFPAGQPARPCRHRPGQDPLEWGLFEGGKRVGEMGGRRQGPLGGGRGRVGRGPHRLPGQRGLPPDGRRAQGDRPRAGGGPSGGVVSSGSHPLQRGGGDAVGHHRRGDDVRPCPETYYNSIYDYLTALAALEYAMGTSPTPDSLQADGAGCGTGP